MQQLVINEQNARQIYADTTGAFKAIMETYFGKAFLMQNITDRVKTFEDACNTLGIDPTTVFEASDSSFIRAIKKLEIIVRALNEGWEPNWNNSSERKWMPWFWMNDESGFRLNAVYCDLTDSCVGSRLVFKTEELGRYAATQFLDIYKDFMKGI